MAVDIQDWKELMKNVSHEHDKHEIIPASHVGDEGTSIFGSSVAIIVNFGLLVSEDEVVGGHDDEDLIFASCATNKEDIAVDEETEINMFHLEGVMRLMEVKVEDESHVFGCGGQACSETNVLAQDHKEIEVMGGEVVAAGSYVQCL